MKELKQQLEELLKDKKIFTKELREKVEELGFQEAEIKKNVKIEKMKIQRKNLIVKIGLERIDGTFLVIGINKNTAYVKEIE